jgi:formate-dependent nitrite reductase membrane component NrfD
LLFWVGVVGVGLLMPLAVEAADLRGADARRQPLWLVRASAVVPILVAAGGFALRRVIVYAGQASRLV